MPQFHGSERRPLKQWHVVDYEGEDHYIVANYCFNNGEEGLIFRRHHDDDPDQRTHIVAAFAQGGWRFYKEIQSNGQ